MSEWQPIETAPQDDGMILVFVPSTWESPPEWHIARRKRDGFVLQEDDHLYVVPTHWQPLTMPESSIAPPQGQE